MDFFERAHVPKKNVKKDSKSDETLKKQLKQMLEGYKQRDNELIRNSENIFIQPSKDLLDDSSSVSGFSDLILSNSSNESNSIQERLNSDLEESVYNLNEDRKENPEIQKNDSVTTSISSSSTISEGKDLIKSLSDVSQNMDDSTLSDLPDDISLLSSLLETVTEIDSEDSESFDADGALAVKILEKLGKKNNAVKKKIKKRKTSVEMRNEPVKKSIEDEADSENQNDGGSEVEALGSDDTESINDLSGTDDETDKESDNNSILDSNMSSPFVSVTATEMPNESLSQILGNYKHSTMKNMPTDTVVHSKRDTNIFSTEEMSIDDVEVVSLENYDQSKDKEFDFTENYDSVETPNESMINDETENDILQSNQFSETDSIELVEEFATPVKVYHAKDTYVIVLKHPAELFIHGKVNVRTLGGHIDVFGYSLGDQTCELYAPNYNYAHCLKTVESQNAYYGLFSKLTSIGLLVYEAEEIVTSIGDYDGIISLSSLKSREMDFVENYFNVTDLFSKINKYIDNSLRMASQALGCSLYVTRPSKHFEENPSWRQPIKYGLKERSRGIVCGGKGVGKSTFLRYCINRQLSQGPVLVIDLDPGQAEFTVAGSVSATVVGEPMLGPNFTHLRKPEKMLYLGMVNTMDNPRRYAAAVYELITFCRNTDRYKDMPWIVNTMGMCNAMGLKFISLIILHTKPTYLLQIDSKTAKKRFECHLNPGMIRNLFIEQYQHDYLFENVTNSEELDYSFFVCNQMESSMKRDFSLAPRDQRYLNYLAYFGQLFKSSKLTSLLGITPYEVDIDQMYIGMNVRVKEDLALKVLNGKIVALCELAQENGSRVFALTDKPLLCYGHGLIRAVDYVKGKLYIITPSTELSEVNTLVYADWVPELRGQEQHLSSGATVPYRTIAAYQKRQLMLAPRRRFNPLQLLKMSRSS